MTMLTHLRNDPAYTRTSPPGTFLTGTSASRWSWYRAGIIFILPAG